MGSIGPAEILLVLMVALLVLGPKRLPDAARQLGRAMGEFRRISSDLQAEVRDAFNEPSTTPTLEGSTAVEGPLVVDEPLVVEGPAVVEGGEATPATDDR